MKYLLIALIWALSLGTAYAVTFNLATTSEITLTCPPPTTNTDKSLVTDRVQYQFHIGLSKSDKPVKMGPVLNRCELPIDTTGLSAVTVYYYVTAKALSGGESVYSNAVEIVFERTGAAPPDPVIPPAPPAKEKQINAPSLITVRKTK